MVRVPKTVIIVMSAVAVLTGCSSLTARSDGQRIPGGHPVNVADPEPASEISAPMPSEVEVHNARMFDGQAKRDEACIQSEWVPREFQGDPAHEGVYDCWTGKVHGKAFRLVLWYASTDQGFALTIGDRTVVKTAIYPRVFAFSGDYACWFTHAGAYGEALNLMTGESIGPTDDRFRRICEEPFTPDAVPPTFPYVLGLGDARYSIDAPVSMP